MGVANITEVAEGKLSIEIPTVSAVRDTWTDRPAVALPFGVFEGEESLSAGFADLLAWVLLVLGSGNAVEDVRWGALGVFGEAVAGSAELTLGLLTDLLLVDQAGVAEWEEWTTTAGGDLPSKAAGTGVGGLHPSVAALDQPLLAADRRGEEYDEN